MAGETSQEKTEDATPKRLREARKKGQVAKSKDLVMIFVMVMVFVAMALTMGYSTGELKQLMQSCFDLVAQPKITGYDIMAVGKMSFFVLAKVLAPILLAAFFSALILGFLQVGPMFSAEVLSPKFEKLNPIEGFKNMFKMATFIELIKNIVKLGIVMYLAYSTIGHYLQEILLSPKVGIIESVMITGDIVYSFFVKVAVIFMAIALIDMGVQRWNFLKNMRMSKDEVKREYKQDEGDPQIKGERRRLHREMVFGDTRKNVKKADAVVSNPIHVAVAIQYNRAEMAAPEVVAKGQRRYAEMILEIAREENIPIIRNIPLAWSLLQLEEGDAIPEDLYEPVAEVLSLVYEMKEKQTAPKQAKTEAQSSSPKNPSETLNPFG